MSKKLESTVDEFVAELRKTKGGVTVSEENGQTVVRTRDGDEHRFGEAWKPLDAPTEA